MTNPRANGWRTVSFEDPVAGRPPIADQPASPDVVELQDLLREWDRFGSDACYIEEDGTIC